MHLQVNRHQRNFENLNEYDFNLPCLISASTNFDRPFCEDEIKTQLVDRLERGRQDLELKYSELDRQIRTKSKN